MAYNRRNMLRMGGAAVVALATGLVPQIAAAAQTITGVFYIPQSYKALSFGANGFVERFQAALGDTAKLDYFDSGKLLKADEQLPALRSGNIDFMFHTSSYITRSVPILGITGLPGVVEALYENPDRMAKGSPLFELINEELAKEDLLLLTMMGNILQPEYVWSTEANPIKSIADVKGKKIRVVSFEATKVVEEFGGAAVRIPSSELFLALQRNTVDAAVANISTVIGRSLHEQTKYVYKLPLTGFGIGLFVDNRRWEKMDPAVKTAMETAADWLEAEGAKVTNTEVYPNEFWPMIDEAGIEVIEPSQEDLDQLAEAAKGVLEAWKKDVGEEVGQRAIDLAMGKEG